MMARDYSGYSVEQLLQRINVLEAQLASTKYGLYWDKEIKPEDVVQKCLSYIPVLKENRDFCIESPNPVSSNILIEGDNFHVLAALKTIAPESGLVDVIYIDPPYNTGAKDFKYNDSFVDVEDGYRHSKWLSFMEKRLLLAKSLLKENGVIFISIDDNEANNLGLLCNQIFGKRISSLKCLESLKKVEKLLTPSLKIMITSTSIARIVL
jgi:adenine-specific DNA-methyltransferase